MNRVILGLAVVFFAFALASGVAHLTSPKVTASAVSADLPAAVNAQLVTSSSLDVPSPAPAEAATLSDPPAPAANAVAAADPSPSAAPSAQPAAPPQPVGASAVHPGSSASVGPLEHIVQSLNNCGPASVAEVLNHWGINKTQGELTFLRHGDPIGMNSDYVAEYVQRIGMRELVANQGSQDVIKALVANGFPVIVSQYVSTSDQVDHFRPIEAYDNASGYFMADDPLMGDGYRISYAQFDQIWGRYDHFFMVIFPPAKQDLLNSVIALTGFHGPSWMTPAS